MGINNTVMYEKVCKARAKQQVALECLSYHATAADTDVSKLKVRLPMYIHVPACISSCFD